MILHDGTESLADALKRASREAVTLVRQEFELAKIEIVSKLKGLGVGAAFLILAALLLVASVATLTATLVLAFSLVVAPWLAALIVTALYLVVAIVLALAARGFITRAIPPVPERTLESVKENLTWLKTRTKSNTR